jgi:hypothetical protein
VRGIMVGDPSLPGKEQPHHLRDMTETKQQAFGWHSIQSLGPAS